MMENNLLALYGLKHRPFTISVGVENLWVPPYAKAFIDRVDDVVLDGGFALLCGEAGLGKSKIMQVYAQRLKGLSSDIVAGVMQRPQNSLSDFYRELGDLFGIPLSTNNRYGGFKALRTRWHSYMASCFWRPVLLIDEAQEMSTICLNELRLLISENFDSDYLMTVVLSGDTRLLDRLATRELIPLGSRIRTRHKLQALDNETLRDFLDHQLDAAGAPQLMTQELKNTCVEHCGGNLRILCAIGTELLNAGADRDLRQLDEKLYLELFGQQPPQKSRTRR